MGAFGSLYGEWWSVDWSARSYLRQVLRLSPSYIRQNEHTQHTHYYEDILFHLPPSYVIMPVSDLSHVLKLVSVQDFYQILHTVTINCDHVDYPTDCDSHCHCETVQIAMNSAHTLVSVLSCIALDRNQNQHLSVHSLTEKLLEE
jgi:hypothetical protein